MTEIAAKHTCQHSPKKTRESTDHQTENAVGSRLRCFMAYGPIALPHSQNPNLQLDSCSRTRVNIDPARIVKRRQIMQGQLGLKFAVQVHACTDLEGAELTLLYTSVIIMMTITITAALSRMTTIITKMSHSNKHDNNNNRDDDKYASNKKKQNDNNVNKH